LTFCLWFRLKTIGTVFSGLASKPMATVSPDLSSKPVARVSWLGHQNRQLWFGDLGLKITAMVSWFVPQNQEGFGLSVAPQNRREGDGVRHASRYHSLLRVEVSRFRVFQSGLKTGRDVKAGDACGTIMEVASESS
jgi:hypothetical protein